MDLQLLARRWSEGRPLRRIPYRPMPAWAPRVTVLVDRSSRLLPFWKDQRRIVHELRRRLGRAAIHEVWYREELSRPWCDEHGFYRSPPVLPGSPVLAVTDLGFLGAGAQRALWWKTGRMLSAGTNHFSALVPCPASRWTHGMTQLWDAVDWGQPRHPGRRVMELSEDERQKRAERLLTLVAFASRIEPGLLRALRQLLPATDADSGTEADVWNHPEVLGGFVSVAGLSSAARSRYQVRFAALPDERKRQVVAVMRAWRAGLPKEIWWDEVLALEAGAGLPPGTLFQEELKDARRLWGRMAATVEGADSGPQVVARAVREFVQETVIGRLPEAVWKDRELRPVLWRAWKASWQGEGEPPLPTGVGPDVLGGGAGALVRWQLVQQGGSLRFRPSAEALEAGSPLASLATVDAQVKLESGAGGVAHSQPMGPDLAPPLPASAFLTLRTDRAGVTLRPLTRPAWATAMGRDRYGLWASFEVEGVEQRLRWIQPGRYWMGSPEDEPGRWEAEGPRHLEEIHRGFWLAETPCTQALWQVVTGKNPSEFQSPRRPVEQVSWEDCRRFLGQLNGRIAGLEARLPLEVEWEYACRAGTEAATYGGPLEILGANNAPVLDAIAWYGGNSGVGYDLEEGYNSSGWSEKQHPHEKAGTHEVGLKARNPWGLYDMLGNVYEWCEDLWRPRYDAPAEGTFRVVRGGS